MNFDIIAKQKKSKVIWLKPRKEMKSSPWTIEKNKELLKRGISDIKPKVECRLPLQPKRIMNKTHLNQFYKV